MTELFIIAGVHVLAVMSPGPDLAMVLRNALSTSRSAGVATAFWLGAWVMVHGAYCLFWLGIIISQSILVFSLIKWAWACYLIYIAFKMLTSKTEITKAEKSQLSLTKWHAFRMGFITNILNPKVTLFFSTIYTSHFSWNNNYNENYI